MGENETTLRESRDRYQRQYEELLLEVEALRRDATESRDLLAAARALVGQSAWPVIERTYPRATHRGSQHDEDGALAELLPEERGFYVDVGASHPTECSNTWQLYHRGWSGLLVEPLPQCWYRLLRDRPRDRLAPFAAWDSDGYARLRVAGTVSSVRPDWGIEEQGTLVVETRRLSTILDAAPEVRDKCSLLSIDCEGAEAQVLRGVDWGRFRPRVVVVEYREYDAAGDGVDATDRLEPALVAAGYEPRHQNRLNRVYVHPGAA